MRDQLASNFALLKAYGDGKYGDDLYRGTSEDGPITHSVAGWSSKLGVKPKDIEAALIRVFKKRTPLPTPLRSPKGVIVIACLELLKTREGCDVLYRVVANEIEFEQKVQRVLTPRDKAAEENLVRDVNARLEAAAKGG